MFRKGGKQSEEDLLEERAPTPGDYSSVAIKKALGKHTRNHWTSRYSWVPLGVGALWAIFIGLTETVFLFLLGSVAAAVAPWVILYFFRAGTFQVNYVNGLHEKSRQITERRRIRLKQGLEEHGCHDGSQQLDKLKAKFDSLYELLGDKLESGEMMFQRYQGIALEVFLSGVDNLTRVLHALKSVREIDPVYIENHLKTLKKQAGSGDAAAATEAQVLESRLKLRENQLAEVQRLLLENEEAMTTLDETTVVISAMDTGQDEGKIDMENSIRDLAEIAERGESLSYQNTDDSES